MYSFKISIPGFPRRYKAGLLALAGVAGIALFYIVSDNQDLARITQKYSAPVQISDIEALAIEQHVSKFGMSFTPNMFFHPSYDDPQKQAELRKKVESHYLDLKADKLLEMLNEQNKNPVMFPDKSINHNMG